MVNNLFRMSFLFLFLLFLDFEIVKGSFIANIIHSERVLTSNTNNTCSDSNCAFCSVSNINYCLQCNDINFFIRNGKCVSMCEDLGCLTCEKDNINQMKCTRCIQGHSLQSSTTGCK